MDLENFRSVITQTFPELSVSRFRVLDQGWDSVAIDVDGRLIFKFPRHETARQNLTREAGLLTTIRSAITMRVPDLTLHHGPPLFSRHDKIAGEHLLTAQYDALQEAARQQIAADMGLFYAQLHGLDKHEVEKAGAEPIAAWLPPELILERVWPVLPSEVRTYADKTISAWQELPADPYGVTFGFFDGHGWNMAFDHGRKRLNGIYDFGDSGFGLLHQEFIYSNLIAPDLTRRIVREYEALTGRVLDRERIHLLTSVLKLSELAEFADDPEHAPGMLASVVSWAAQSSFRPVASP